MMTWTWFIIHEVKRIISRLTRETFSPDTTFRRIKRITLFLILLGCAESLAPEQTYFTHESHKIWYQYTGEKEKIPLIILHGGPGMPSYYLEPLTQLSDSIPIIIYDQLGAGRSDIPDNDESYHVGYYVDELEALRKHIGLTSFYLMGHSWGGYLATAYYNKYRNNVEKLILASPLLDVDLWVNDADSLKSLLPQQVKDTIDHYEIHNQFDNEAYLRAVGIFYDKHFVRKPHRLVDSTFKHMGTHVYNLMWGNTEFNCTGSLGGASLIHSLYKIQIPVLLTGGTFDECPPTRINFFASRIEQSTVLIIDDASHMTMIEKPKRSREVIYDFLKGEKITI